MFGTHIISLLYSSAHAAVIDDPLPFLASVTNSPLARAAIILLRIGKLPGLGSVTPGYSLITKWSFLILSYKS